MKREIMILVTAASLATSLLGQTVQAELSAADTVELQRQVDAVVGANPGSRQINQNEIELAPGAVVTVPLPGEKIARGPGEVVTEGVANCPYQNSCWYEHANFDGYRLRLYYCGFYNLGNLFMLDGRRWNDKISSWHNNQSGGAVADTYNWNGSAWDVMFRAYVGRSSYVGAWANDIIDGIWNCP